MVEQQDKGLQGVPHTQTLLTLIQIQLTLIQPTLTLITLPLVEEEEGEVEVGEEVGEGEVRQNLTLTSI